MKRITTVFLLLLVSTILLAQNEKEIKTLFKKAETHLLYEEYDLALPIYLKIIDKGWDNANIQFNVGMCYLNVQRQIKQAIPYFEKAIINVTSNYKEGNYKEKRAPKEAWFYLAKSYRIDGQFDKAIEAYLKYKSIVSVSDVYIHDFIELQVKTCNNAKLMMSKPIKFIQTEQDFGESGDNYFPAVAGNGKSIAFTAYQEEKDPDYGTLFFENIKYSVKDDKEWGKPRDLTSDIASDGYFSSVYLSYNGDFLILYRNDYGNGNLYYSELKGKRWSSVVKFPKQISSRSNETKASLSKDGTVLYFVSDRLGGFGGKDIWYSIKDNKGRWGTPTNLGEVINTTFEEEAPAISEDGNTLYFASEAHNSMGGYDIFKSTKNSEGVWSEPQNLGYPINTTDDDYFYIPIGDGNLAYMAKYPKTGGFKKIYSIEFMQTERVIEVVADDADVNDSLTMANNTDTVETDKPVAVAKTIIVPSEYELKGTLSLQDNKKLDPSFYIHVLKEDGEVIAALSPDVETGKFRTKLKYGSYVVKAYGDGYETAEKHIVISEDQQSPEVLSFLEMVPLTVSTGEYFVIKSILFDYNSTELDREAKIEIEKLATLMEKNPSLYVEVVGNTDDRGTDEYNQKLSIKRSRAVVDYIHNKGIDKSRFVTKGLGKTNFIAINENPDGSDNPEGRRLNRRVDIKIVRSNDDKIITENIYVPDELKYKKYLTYTIFLMETDKPLKPSYFSKSGENINNVWMFRTDAGYLYTVGKFNHQSEALTLMNKVVDAGFPDAKVISSIEYNELIQNNSNFFKSKMLDTDKNVYTIQLFALKNPIDASQIKGLSDVEVVHGEDGYYRYIYGEFIGKTSAKQELLDVMQKGYYDAFIVDRNKY
jgi:outer membrane protein OmpA-like peptidoglycan-associated protein/tetratricopeptide (TPR) repeat protein